MEREAADWAAKHAMAVEAYGAMPGRSASATRHGAAAVIAIGALVAIHADSRARGLLAALVAALALPRVAAWVAWSRWAGPKSPRELHWGLWREARAADAAMTTARRRVGLALLSSSALRGLGAAGAADKLEARCVAMLGACKDVARERSEALWRLKSAVDPAGCRVQCHSVAVAMSLAWGDGESAAQWGSKLRRLDGAGWVSRMERAEQLELLARRWDALGERARWSPWMGSSSGAPESAGHPGALSFADAFDGACAACEARGEPAPASRLKLLAQQEAEALARMLGEVSGEREGKDAPLVGAGPKRL